LTILPFSNSARRYRECRDAFLGRPREPPRGPATVRGIEWLRWQAYPYDDIIKRDKCSLDIFWLRDESLEDADNLPDPDVIAAEIVEDLKAALEQFAEIQADLTKG
jgi:hypothetical protein